MRPVSSPPSTAPGCNRVRTDATVLAANANFLTTVATRSRSAGAPSRDVRRAWLCAIRRLRRILDRLRGGAFASGMFQRVGKGGAHHLDPGELQPDFDPTGRLTKIVKYATDVSANMAARSHGH